MFSVKVVYPEKREKVFDAQTVDYYPPDVSKNEKSRLICWEPLSNGSHFVEIFSGTAYVMNNNGKTVGTYHLGVEPNVP